MADKTPQVPEPGKGFGMPRTPDTKNIPGALGVGMDGKPLSDSRLAGPKSAADGLKNGKIDAGAVAGAVAGKYGTNKDGTKNLVGAGSSIAAGAAAGAAGGNAAGKLVGGGIQGAVAGGLQESLKKENRKGFWKPVMMILALFMIPNLIIGSLIGMTVISGFNNSENKGATTEKDSAKVIAQAGLDPQDTTNMFEAGQNQGVNWQIIASLYNYQKTHTMASACAPVVETTTTSGTETIVEPAPLPPATAEWVHPIAGSFRVGSRYGMRFHPVLHVWKMHWGQDFGAASGTPLVGMGKGRVSFVGTNKGAGNHIKMKFDADPSVEITYMHMVEPSPLSVGSLIDAGTQVGKIGSTGYSTGPHLHLQIEVNGSPTDPLPWMRNHGIDPAVGYTGEVTDSSGFGDCLMDGTDPEDSDDPEYLTMFALEKEAMIDRILVSEMSFEKPENATEADRAEAETRAMYINEEANKPVAIRFVADWIADLIKSGPLNVYTDFATGMQIDPESQSREINPSSEDAKKVREAYVKALAQLPAQGVFENESTSDQIFQTALNWYLGKQSGGFGMVCAPAGGETLTVKSSTTGATVTLDAKMLGYAATAVNVAKQYNVNENGQLIMLMTIFQESRYKMYANSTVPASLGYPHDAVGSDHDSVGLFQQRVNAGAWGPLPNLMDVAKSTEAFLGVADWASAPGLLDKFPDQNYPGDLGAAAQAVQVSAFPTLYSQWEEASRTLLGKVSGITCGASNINAVNGEPATWTDPKGVTYQIPGGGCTKCVISALEMYKRDMAEFGGDLRYSWGGGDRTGPTMGILNAGYDHRDRFGFDCSGLSEYAVWQGLAAPFPTTAQLQYNYLVGKGKLKTSYSQLLPGDMVYFRSPGNIYHVAVYMGNGKIVHSRNVTVGLQIDDFTPGSYWVGEFTGGGLPV